MDCVIVKRVDEQMFSHFFNHTEFHLLVNCPVSLWEIYVYLEYCFKRKKKIKIEDSTLPVLTKNECN